jgi:hypothetical protein
VSLVLQDSGGWSSRFVRFSRSRSVLTIIHAIKLRKKFVSLL